MLSLALKETLAFVLHIEWAPLTIKNKFQTTQLIKLLFCLEVFLINPMTHTDHLNPHCCQSYHHFHLMTSC